MPETYWTVRWPDGQEERLYSPSTVIKELFEPGTSYPLPDFLHRARIGLERASNRVAAKYGLACSAALDQLDRIEARSTDFNGQEGAEVTLLGISD
ncbi:MSMEG_0570 family nitrogen starvation response protein [Pseudooceanicola sp. CBS1P-1]|uniref:MSMEG_0570 family nitrogen starvation response protein n=1 Tax=Pseudooceanicola albus TaxID=2692189 RepID=A0A6L7G179_9RHOB|nr:MULTISPECIES: MSMEG_0570 family nitrogen starvation response protein [Pseudooceanicola]MBT9383354.1 MSMEG_0570 family nitrogen starvation response protein [Pseudooceanicola endophyticus]MXN16323.1 MSMEG_0570 family nitrogen starvation response protein [Pseudooceanicola albus]